MAIHPKRIVPACCEALRMVGCTCVYTHPHQSQTAWMGPQQMVCFDPGDPKDGGSVTWGSTNSLTQVWVGLRARNSFSILAKKL
jgi:hypothetical protein